MAFSVQRLAAYLFCQQGLFAQEASFKVFIPHSVWRESNSFDFMNLRIEIVAVVRSLFMRMKGK